MKTPSEDHGGTDVLDLIERLKAHEQRLSPENESAFARDHLNVSPATWNKLKAGSYPFREDSKIGRCIISALRVMDEDLASPKQKKRKEPLHLSMVVSVLNAIKIARGEDQNRLVVLLAPTGGGKTSTARAVRLAYPNSFIAEGSPTWQWNYFAAARSIALAAGQKEKELRGAAQSEDTLITHLQEKCPVVIIDEGHNFGLQTINLVKVMLNKSRSVVLLNAIPKLWNQMTARAQVECAQIRRRTTAIVRSETVKEADVKLMLDAAFPDFKAHTDRDAIAKLLTTEGNRFGLLDTVGRIIEMASEDSDGRAAKLETADFTTFANEVAKLQESHHEKGAQ